MLAACLGVVSAQSGPLNIVGGKIDFSGAAHTVTVIVAATSGALPSSGCTPGELAMVKAASPLSAQMYQNSGTGTCVWTQQYNLTYTPLNPANNLSDVGSASTSRTNLGVSPATLKGTTGSIGGGALLAGACATGTVSVTGATTSMTAAAAPALGIDPTNGGVLGVAISARVSSSNTVTVSVCAPIAGTPTAATYAVTVYP